MKEKHIKKRLLILLLVFLAKVSSGSQADDPMVKALVDASAEDISDIVLDFAESQLHKQIKENNTASTIFYLKTKGKKRGYIEAQDINFNTKKNLPEWMSEGDES